MRYTFTLLCCIFFTTSFAQPICGFDQIHQTRLAVDPQYANQVKLNEQKIQKIITASKSRSVQGFGTLSTAIIPVVVHVINTGGAVGTIYNPADADIQGAIDYLNQVYAADPSVTTGSVALNIQFVLAKRTPYCSATTGIERIDGSGIPNYAANGVNVNGTSGTDEINVKNLSRWDPNSYYNIWVVNEIDGNDGTHGQFIAGYAYFAGAPASLDGTVMLATQMKSGQKTLPHEMGHAFSLYHPFQGSADKNSCPPNNNCNTDGDMVCDTDPISYNQLNGVVNFTPRTGPNPCANNNPYTANTESNFMNYTTSYLLFTAGQGARVGAALSSSRASLANSVGSLSIDMAPACISQINFEVGSSSVTEATTGVIGCRGYTDYTYHLLSSGPQPSQAVTATLVTGGTALRGFDYDITTNGSFTSPSLDIPFSTAGNETKSFTVRIYDDKAIELQKTISLSFTLNNSGSSIGNVNPTLAITLNDDDVAPVPYASGSTSIGTPTYAQNNESSCFSGDLYRHRVQYLYRQSDLYNAGIVNAAVLSAIKFQISSKSSTKAYTGFTVSMGQVPATTTVLGNFVSTTGFTTVYSANYTTVAGVNNIPFSTNFNWDGQSNIVINICFDNGTTKSNVDALVFGANLGSGQTVTVCSNGTGASSGCSLPAYDLYTISPVITFDYAFGSPVESLISSDIEYLGANTLVYFKDASGKLLAGIQNQSSFDYGCTKVEIDRAGTSAVTFWHNTNDKKVATTTFKVTPTNINPSGQYKITLYYTKSEIDGWKSVTGKNLSDVDMRMVKISNHNISDVTPTTPYVPDVQWAAFTKAAFGSDTAISATFSSGFSGFGIGAMDVTPLPVTWLTFNGKRLNDNVILNWSTSTENNNNYFDVETSVDGANFYKAGQVKGKGNSTLTQQYSFTHYSPVVGANYYRLKQVDLNGEFTYSNVITVQFDYDKGQTVSIYPSPVSNELNITFSKNQENVMLRVISIDGKVVETKQIGSILGKTSINVSSLVSGIYILQVRVDNEWKQFKFIKQ
jgi:hypothetical protein